MKIKLKELGPKILLPYIHAINGNESDLPPLVKKTLQSELKNLPKVDHIWEVLFPEGLHELNEKTISEIRNRRSLDIITLNPAPISDLSREFLITSNVLLDVPVDPNNVSDSFLREELLKIKSNCKQKYFYDHPIPMDTPLENNEIVYGLKNLNQAIIIEKEKGIFPKDKKLKCILSLTTTYDGLTHLSKRYLQSTLAASAPLENLEIYAFSENDTLEIIKNLIKDASSATHNFSFFGVSGEYGRHYSFLKSITALLQSTIFPDLKGSFKIDLDQVFDQEKLIKETGRTAFSHFKSPLWGAQAKDDNGNIRPLGMIAGALVNQEDAHKSIFTPDVTMPKEYGNGETEFFCSQIPQAISTVAEMMPDTNEDFSDEKKTVRSRIHVTGGTNGILVEDLKRFQPFTPSFIGRAEDQAYLLSTFNNSFFGLAYLHKPGLVMRHDKEGFAGEAIAKAKLGRIVGDYQRILLFSAYAKKLDPTLEKIKKQITPFTGCFVTKFPLLTALLRLITKVQNTSDLKEAEDLAELGINRITETVRFVAEDLSRLIDSEKSGYKDYYLALESISQKSKYKKIMASIMDRCRLN